MGQICPRWWCSVWGVCVHTELRECLGLSQWTWAWAGSLHASVTLRLSTQCQGTGAHTATPCFFFLHAPPHLMYSKSEFAANDTSLIPGIHMTEERADSTVVLWLPWHTAMFSSKKPLASLTQRGGGQADLAPQSGENSASQTAMGWSCVAANAMWSHDPSVATACCQVQCLSVQKCRPPPRAWPPQRSLLSGRLASQWPLYQEKWGLLLAETVLVCVHVHMWAWKLKVNPAAVSLVFVRQGFPLACSLPSRLGLLKSKPRGPSHLCGFLFCFVFIAWPSCFVLFEWGSY